MGRFLNSLEQHKSYCLHNFIVKEYSSVKYLSIAHSNCTIEETSDMGEVQNIQHPKEDLCWSSKLDRYKGHLRCKGRAEPSTPPLGRCSKLECNMLQNYDICNISAKLLFSYKSKMNASPPSSNRLWELMK